MLTLLTPSQSGLPTVGALQAGITQHILVMLVLAGSGLHSLWRQQQPQQGKERETWSPKTQLLALTHSLLTSWLLWGSPFPFRSLQVLICAMVLTAPALGTSLSKEGRDERALCSLRC